MILSVVWFLDRDEGATSYRWMLNDVRFLQTRCAVDPVKVPPELRQCIANDSGDERSD